MTAKTTMIVKVVIKIQLLRLISILSLLEGKIMGVYPHQRIQVKNAAVAVKNYQRLWTINLRTGIAKTTASFLNTITKVKRAIGVCHSKRSNYWHKKTKGLWRFTRRMRMQKNRLVSKNKRHKLRKRVDQTSLQVSL